MERFVGLIGFLLILCIAYLCSNNKKSLMPIDNHSINASEKFQNRNEFNNKIFALSNDINTNIDNSLYDGILIKPFSENDIFEKLKLI